MKGELRKSGIDIIGDVPWGAHFCQFYRTKEDLIDILVPYFKAGLENNEYCMWVTAHPLTEKEAEEAIRRAVPDFALRMERGQLEIIPHTDWYLKGGAFNQQRVLNGWVERLNAALKKGFDGLRLTGNTFWLEKEDWKAFTDYEEVVNSVIGNYKIIAACTYSLDKCAANEIIDVVQNHQYALIKRKGEWKLIESSERKLAVGEIRKLNEELKRKVTQLEAANKELDAFSYSVSHDLCAPLRSIDGFSHALFEDHYDRLDEAGKDYLNRILDATGGMRQLIDDLLKLSQVSRAGIKRESVNLSDVVRKISDRFKNTQPQRNVEFKINEDLIAFGDGHLLTLVIENLLGNAWKFTSKHSTAKIEFGALTNFGFNSAIRIPHSAIVSVPQSAIRIPHSEIEGKTVYFVRDDGVGFDMKYGGRLFQPFQRLHGMKEFLGTGIGLATVKRIIERHGGIIWAESEVEKGAIFYFTLG